MVRVFSTPVCPYCETLKEYFKEKNIVFDDIDVSKDEKAMNEMIERSGQMTVPVLDINGKIIVGFDKAEIDKLLEIK
jgi:glutaredoxin 3